MRSRWFVVSMFMTAVLFSLAGCWRADNGTYVAEVDEPEYRRAKELLKQGRNPEALVAFERVLAKRGLNNAAETHLDMAILCQQHMRDPLSAIYHYEKYLSLMPNAPRAGVVRQQIEAAKREYLATLPGRPSLDGTSGPQEYVDTINRLRAENDQLRRALLAAQSGAGVIPGGAAGQQGRVVTVENPAVISPSNTQGTQGGLVTSAAANNNPITAVTQQGRQQPAQAQPQPQVQQPTQQIRTQPPQPQTQVQPAQPQTPAVRRHTVQPRESLSSIARQYYGSATNAQIEAIVNANRDVLQSRSTPLRAGMDLKIP